MATKFCPKNTPPRSLARNCESVRSGSLVGLNAPFFTSTVVKMQRSQGLTASNSTSPIRIRFQLSSANGSVPETTKLVRN
ncbi:Uncharacterised protein [Vibrio cholerae]|nr:Uncharacterised protein [Vibrio cholerae]